MPYTPPLRILLTGAGAPGAWGIISALRAAADRRIVIVGVDMRRDAVGFARCDRVHVVPAATSPEFWAAMREILLAERIHVIVPLVTRELEILASRRCEIECLGVRAVVSDPEALSLANDKGRTTEAIREAGLPAPRAKVVHSADGLRRAAGELGYPGVPVVVKPCQSNGSRGVRILDPTIDRLHLLLHEKPSSLISTLDDVAGILEGADPFPPYVVMEYLPGEEYSVDCLADGERALVVVPRRRDEIRQGISFAGTVVYDEEIVTYSRSIVERLRLWGPIGLQVRRDAAGAAKLIEINPRLQGTTALSVAAGVNLPWLSVRLALGESFSVGPIAWGTRVIRYWGDTFWSADGRLLSDGTGGTAGPAS